MSYLIAAGILFSLAAIYLLTGRATRAFSIEQDPAERGRKARLLTVLHLVRAAWALAFITLSLWSLVGPGDPGWLDVVVFAAASFTAFVSAHQGWLWHLESHAASDTILVTTSAGHRVSVPADVAEAIRQRNTSPQEEATTGRS